MNNPINSPYPDTNGMQLPPPVVDQSVPQASPIPPAMPTLQGQPQAAPGAQQAATTAARSVGMATANLAADPTNDLIEKEWVSKAKQIVEQTKDDPYKQSEGLTMVKMDYMKKRYNKSIKYK